MYPPPVTHTCKATALPAMPLLGHRSRLANLSLAAAIVLVAVVLAPACAHAITRPAVLARAQSWVDKPVAYSQSKYHLGYRTDCSGYVSMCWGTGVSWSTSSFHAVTHPIKTAELKPGDAMLKKGYHVRLFHNWIDAAHTRYLAYEASTRVAMARVHSVSTDLRAGYVPTRYNAILDGPAADDVLWNGSFDAWSNSGDWYTRDEQPIMWNVGGPPAVTLVVHRWDVARTGKSSLQLLATDDFSHTPTTISQTASITAGATYRMTAWVRSDSDPAGLRLRLSYLGADGTSITQTSTAGDRCAVDNVSFKPMSVLTTAPAGATNAVVTLSLAPPTAGGTASAIIDDVSLARPRIGVTARASAGSAKSRSRVVLSGVVSPASTAGGMATLYIQRPGKHWTPLAGVAVTQSPSGAAWRSSYRFKPGVRKGLYRFRVSVPALPGYLGNTSNAVAVRLK